MKEYSPFFEWFDKGRKELGVVEELLNSLNQSNQLGFHSPQINQPDPPDCICMNAAVTMEEEETDHKNDI